MDWVRARPLRPYERIKLHRMKRQLANQVNSRHARIILLSRGGMRNPPIAERADCSPQWVRRIIHRFNDGGIEAITGYPCLSIRGSPRKFGAAVTEQIAEVALSSPKALIGTNQWSLSKLRRYLVEQKVQRAATMATGNQAGEGKVAFGPPWLTLAPLHHHLLDLVPQLSGD